eukprot:TRINITY_DN3892_c0_g1_i2.p1 TRINITY_DN3892_c0_g1~~TRINITY_DN3892_c0_g1_i2.p1  ORF type:complete len:144 (-),score=20.04 TRINITY_DN3892_c0_g1_i2:135-509(-)
MAQNHMEEARAIVDSVELETLHNLMGFARPPAYIEKAFEVLSICFGKAEGWRASMAMLQQPDFLRQLRDFDGDSITAEQFPKLKQLVENPELSPAALARCSDFAGKFGLWSQAVYRHAALRYNA